MFVRGVLHQNRRPSAFGIGFFLIAPVPRHLLSSTGFDDGPRISATEWARWRLLDVERGYRRSKACEGEIDHRSRQGRFWLGR